MASRRSARLGTQERAGAPHTESSDSTVTSQDLQQQRIQQLEAQVRELQAAIAEPTIEIPRQPPAVDDNQPSPREPAGSHTAGLHRHASSDAGSAFGGFSDPPAAKTMRPDKMRTYTGESEGEHIRWFADAEIKFLLSPEYFVTDRAKILYCMQSLSGDAANQWRHRFKKEEVDTYTFDYFRTFLLDLVADPTNRRLVAHERWNSARQGKDQKVSAFKAHLEELEDHLEPMTEHFRASMFLSKLRPDLKDKIISTGNVPSTREEILALAIMQERALERYHSNRPKSYDKGRPLEERISKAPNHSSGGEPPSKRRKKDKDKDKDRPRSKSNSNTPAKPEHKSDSCYLCGGKGHWKSECPQKDNPNFTPVNSVQSKNDSAPPAEKGRGKKEKKDK